MLEFVFALCMVAYCAEGGHDGVASGTKESEGSGVQEKYSYGNGSVSAANTTRAIQDLLQKLINSSHLPVNERTAQLCGLTSPICEWDHGNREVPEDIIANKPSTAEVWGLGFAFVTLINLSSVFGVIFFPLMSKRFYKKLLMVMVGLAVGSLSASSVFHLIPQAFNLVDDPTHAYLSKALTLWFGVWVFFIVERILRIIANQKNGNSHEPIPTKEPCGSSTSTEVPSEGGEESVTKYVEADYSHGHCHHQVQFRPGKDNPVATVAWMVVFGDGFHNFIDGLSIGAAFNESTLTGVSISVAVLCEELPHELGDFAVLLSAGMSMRQALVANFLSACTCYVGLILGILIGEFEASFLVFSFAAGMFLYISLVDMMPELNVAMEDASKRGVRKAFETLFLQNVGLLTGVAILFSLATYQESIQLW